MAITEKMKQSPRYAGYNEADPTKPYEVDKYGHVKISKIKVNPKKHKVFNDISNNKKPKKIFKIENIITKDENVIIKLFNDKLYITEICKELNKTRHEVIKTRNLHRDLILLTNNEMKIISNEARKKSLTITPRKLKTATKEILELLKKGKTNTEIVEITGGRLKRVQQIRHIYKNRKDL